MESKDQPPIPAVETKEPEIDMEAFREEIAKLIIDTWKGENKIGIYVSKKINQNHLKKEDAVIWYKVKNYKKGSFSPADLEAYEKNVMSEKNEQGEIIENDSRIVFYVLITKKLADTIIKRLNEEMSKNNELSLIEPEELKEKDVKMLLKYESDLITPSDVVENSLYDRDVKKDIKEPCYGSRENLLAFFRQVLTSSQLEKQQIEHDNSLNGNSKK